VMRSVIKWGQGKVIAGGHCIACAAVVREPPSRNVHF